MYTLSTNCVLFWLLIINYYLFIEHNGMSYLKVKSRISMANAAFNRKNLFTSQLEVNVRRKQVKFYIWSTSFYGAGNLDTSECRSEIPGNFVMWCWRHMEKISWTDIVRNEEVLQVLVREKYLKHVTEGKIEGRIEMTERRGRWSKQLLGDLKEKRGCWKLKEGALDRPLWRTCLKKRL